MKETIATIPVNDLFAPKDGCPFCRMERMLEEQYCEFVTGDAMMEPLIRIETNKKGFCNRHFTRMTQVGQKLPNALILESHLQEIMEQYMPKKAGKPDKKQLEALPFICLHHYRFMMTAAAGKGGMPSKLLADFHAETLPLVKGYLETLKADISHFVTMFDYRNKGKDWGTSVGSIERSIEFLTKEKPKETE